MTPLPPEFLARPLAHRGYHDVAAGRPENSCAAFEAAITSDYGIELDVQMSSDGHAIVFHDYDLDRLTSQTGPVRARNRAELGTIPLNGGEETIPDLAKVLTVVAGRTPLLIEIKDQDGAMGPDVGPLEQAVAAAVDGYQGPVGVMSFNPNGVRAFGTAAPDVPRGLVSAAFSAESWSSLPAAALADLRDMPLYDQIGATFISHQVDDLDRPRVSELKAGGATVICWTVRSAGQEAQARRIAHNITFEGYAARSAGP